MTHEILLPTNLREVRAANLTPPEMIHPPISFNGDISRLFDSAYHYMFRMFYPEEITDNLQILPEIKLKGNIENRLEEI